jgi:hypothetical protein
VYVSTDGAVRHRGVVGGAGVVDLRVHVGKGHPSAPDATRRLSVVKDSSSHEGFANWSFGRAYTLPNRGVQTFVVEARMSSFGEAEISGDAESLLRGQLTVMTITA